MRKKELEKQMQIMKDRGAALSLSTGSEIVIGVVTREGDPILWSTPGLHDFMVRDCDFNDTAPAGVAVAHMLQQKRGKLSANIANLPIEDKRKALAVVFRDIHDPPGQFEWYPRHVPYKDPMTYTEMDRDLSTHELHVDILLKISLMHMDAKKLQNDFQFHADIGPESLGPFLVCVRKLAAEQYAQRQMLMQQNKRAKKIKKDSCMDMMSDRIPPPPLIPIVALPPPDAASCELVWRNGRPFLGMRASVEQMRVCLNNEPSIKYNKGGTVKVAGFSVNLHDVYNKVREYGGYKMLTDNRGWRVVAQSLQMDPNNSDACRSLKNAYQRYLCPLSGVSPPRTMPTAMPVTPDGPATASVAAYQPTFQTAPMAAITPTFSTTDTM